MPTNDYFDNSTLPALPKGATARAEAVDSKYDSITTGLDKLPSENEFNRGTRNYAVTTGSGGAYIASIATITAYNDGQELHIRANHSNPAGGSTVNVSGIGATSIFTADGSNLPLNAMVSDGTYSLRYNSELSGYVLQTGAGAVLTSGAADTTSITDAGNYFTDPGSGKQVEAALQEAAADISINALTANQFRAHEAPTPDMTVIIAAGKVQNGTAVTSVSAQTTISFVAPVANPRIDRIIIYSATGGYAIITGAEGVAPVPPTLPVNHFPVCQVLLSNAPATTAITNSMIVDERVVNPDFRTLNSPTLNSPTINGSVIGDSPKLLLNTKVINMGAWDMVANSSLFVSHGLDYAKIRSVNATISDDNADTFYSFPIASQNATSSEGLRFGVFGVFLFRADAGGFDDISFDNNSINRGYITIQYID